MFSIIIPAFNDLILFKKALASVLGQKNVDYEIVIIDDSDVDSIEKYIANVSDYRIRYFRNRPKKGAVQNWNYGLSLAKGDYIILLHHDESLCGNDYLLNCNKVIKERGCNVLISNVDVVFGDKNIKGNKNIYFLKAFVCKFFVKFLYIFNILGPTAAIVINKNCINKFDENLVLLVDVDWYNSILKEKKVYLSKHLKITSVYGHDYQISKNLDKISLRLKEELYLMHKNGDIALSVLFYFRKILFKVLAKKYGKGIIRNIFWN